MTKRRARAKPKPGQKSKEPVELVLLEEMSVVTNYEKIRLDDRGLDTFTITLKEGGGEIKVQGHDIALDSSGTQDAKLPIYQIFEYNLVSADVRLRKAFNEGKDWDQDRPAKVHVSNVTNHEYYVKVIKAILWPGEWTCITRELGDKFV